METKQTTKGIDFCNLIYNYNRNPSPELENQILDLLIANARGIEDPNVLLNKFGNIHIEKATWSDPKVIICNALAILANYDVYKISVYTRAKEYYRDIILRELHRYGIGCSLQETINRFKEFVR